MIVNRVCYYERGNRTIKGVIIAARGDKCVVRSREEVIPPLHQRMNNIFNLKQYEDVEKIVKLDDLFIEDFDDTQSYVNRIRAITGSAQAASKIVDMSLRLTVRLAGYGIPLKDDAIDLLGKYYAVNGLKPPVVKRGKKK